MPPIISNMNTLIEQFQTSYESPSKRKSPKSNFVKRIVEAYETNSDRRDRSVLSPGKDHPDAGSPDVARTMTRENDDARRESPEDSIDSINGSLRIMRRIQRILSAASISKDDEALATETSSSVKIVVDHVEEGSDLNKKVEEVPATSPDVSRLTPDVSPVSSDRGRGSKIWRFVSKMNVQNAKLRRGLLSSNTRGKDELWNSKRKGKFFTSSPTNGQFLEGSEKSAIYSPNNSRGSIAEDAPSDVIECVIYDDDDDEILKDIETLDDSGNSYRNLQIDMFGFEDAETTSEPTATEFVEVPLNSADDVARNVESNYFPPCSRQIAEHSNTALSSETASFPSAENETSDRRNAESSSFGEPSNEGKLAKRNAEDTRAKRTPRRPKLTDMTRYISNRIKSYVKRERQGEQDSRRSPPRPRSRQQQHARDSDENHRADSSSTPVSETRKLSFFRICLEIRMSKVNASRRINGDKARPSREGHADACPGTEIVAHGSAAKLEHVDAASSKGASETRSLPRLPKHPNLYQVLPKHPFVSTMKMDEAGVTGRSYAPQPRRGPPCGEWTVSTSPRRADDGSRWRSTSALDGIAVEERSLNVPTVACGRPPFNVRRDSHGVNSSASPSSTGYSYTRSEPCFATVKPRNYWRFRVHPDRLRSLD